jgi:hypothetical protein
LNGLIDRIRPNGKSRINVTLTSINQERFVHESFGDVVLCPAGIARLLAGSNG